MARKAGLKQISCSYIEKISAFIISCGILRQVCFPLSVNSLVWNRSKVLAFRAYVGPV